MTTILERAKAHYAGLPRLRLSVPEWGSAPDKPAVITWTPLTVRDQERIYALNEDGSPARAGQIRIRAVILKACDDGEAKLFDDMAEHDLRHNVDGDIVGRIANAILYSAGLVDKTGDGKPVDKQVDDAKNG